MSTDTRPRSLRITRIALWVNAVLHSTGMAGFVVKALPHGGAELGMALRAVAAGIAGVIAMVAVARRLERDPWLIALPLAFVVGNLSVSLWDALARGHREALASAGVEAIFVSIYAVFAASRLRPPRGA